MSGPLKGITVVDVTTNISGPTLTAILGDLGADVIKIERLDIGDDSRGMGPLWEGHSPYFLHINRNKRSIAANLKQEEGRQIVYDLIRKADIFVENYRFGKAEKMGLGYEKLKSMNPALIYCSVSAYGQEGSRRDKPGYDAIAQAESGIMGINGSEDGGTARVPVSVLDQGSAMWGVIGIVSALFHREQTGEGQRVSTSLYETGVYWVGYHMLSWMATGKEPEKLGTNHAAFSPYGSFAAKDGPIMIGISNNALFKKLCIVLNMEEWAEDPRFAENPARVKHREELNEAIQTLLLSKSADEWIELLGQAGIPSSKIKKISEVANDEQTNAVGMWKKVSNPPIEDLRLPRLPLELTLTPPSIDKPPPQLGQHSVEILKDLGYDDDKIDQLIQSRTIQ